jgi:ankyrin repeat protein
MAPSSNHFARWRSSHRGVCVDRAKGADPCLINAEDGRTALHAASAAGHTEVVSALIASGAFADVLKPDRLGRTATDLAFMGKHLDVVRVLGRAFASPDGHEWTEVGSANYLSVGMLSPSSVSRRANLAAFY